jgi:hypothetical protein
MIRPADRDPGQDVIQGKDPGTRIQAIEVETRLILNSRLVVKNGNKLIFFSSFRNLINY